MGSSEMTINTFAADGPHPVSYTHLDVYKRQVNSGEMYKGFHICPFV